MRRRGLLLEVLGVWFFSSLALHFLFRLDRPSVFWLAASLLVYIPLSVLLVRGEPFTCLGLRLQRPAWSFAVVSASAIALFPAFFLAAHLYEAVLLGRFFKFGIPPGLPAYAAFQLLGVAFPEELFYRGYVQGRLDQGFGRDWQVLGAKVGAGWLAGALLFTAGHSIVRLEWWHFSILPPAMVMGWLREKLGHVYGSALFHAAANVAVYLVNFWYN